MRHPLLAIAFSLCGLVFCSEAMSADAEKNYSPEFDQCIERSGGATYKMIECITAENTKQDKKLNEYYRKLMAKLGEKEKTALRNAQREWIKLRDLDSEVAFLLNGGGSISRIEQNDTFLSMTAERAQLMKALYEVYSTNND